MSICSSVWTEALDENRNGIVEKYLAARMLFLANTRLRVDLGCTGNYLNATCNSMASRLSDLKTQCPSIENPWADYSAQLGELQFIRFSGAACSSSCAQAMENFFIESHCCMGIIVDAQRRWWDLMSPSGSSWVLDLNAYFCLYQPNLCPVEPGQSLEGVDPLSVQLIPTPVSCGSSVESLECHFKSCNPAPWPSSCCYPLGCQNGWKEHHGSCYCRCESSYSGLRCSDRTLHVSSGLEIRQTNYLTFEVLPFREAVATSLGIPLSDCEMAYLEEAPLIRRSFWERLPSFIVRSGPEDSIKIRALDNEATVNAGFRVLMPNERESLRMVETIQIALSTGAIGLTMTRFGFGNLLAFQEEPQAVAPGGVLCTGDACTASGPSTDANISNTGTDEESSGTDALVIIGAAIGGAVGAVLLGCGMFGLLALYHPKVRARVFKEQRVKQLSRAERRQRQMEFKREAEEAKGMRFAFSMFPPQPQRSARARTYISAEGQTPPRHHPVCVSMEEAHYCIPTPGSNDAFKEGAVLRGADAYSELLDERNSGSFKRVSSSMSRLGSSFRPEAVGDEEKPQKLAPTLNGLHIRQEKIRKQIEMLNSSISSPKPAVEPSALKKLQPVGKGNVEDQILSDSGYLNLKPDPRRFTLEHGLVFQDGSTPMPGNGASPFLSPDARKGSKLLASDGLLDGTMSPSNISDLQRLQSPTKTLSPAEMLGVKMGM